MSKSWFQKYATNEEEIHGFAINITANQTPGGQAGGTQLTEKWNRIDTVPVNNSSVKLPAAKIGKRMHVWNNAGLPALCVAVFPQAGEYIDGFLNGNDIGGSSYVSRIPGGKVFTYECYEDGKWVQVSPGALFGLRARVKVTQAQIQTSHAVPVTLLLQHGSYMIVPKFVLHTATNGGYSGNTNAVITSDFNNIEQEHFSFNYDITHNQYNNALPNPNPSYYAPGQGLFFITDTGNPTGAGGDIILLIGYDLILP